MIGRLDRPTAAALGPLYSAHVENGEIPDYGHPTDQIECEGPDGQHVAALAFWHASVPRAPCERGGPPLVQARAFTTRVWYRSSAGWFSIPAFERRGSLTIENGTIWFAGKEQGFSGRIRSVARKRMGMNRWVHVRYETDGEVRDAYFLDSGLLGWAGVLGGNRRLAEAAADRS